MDSAEKCTLANAAAKSEPKGRMRRTVSFSEVPEEALLPPCLSSRGAKKQEELSRRPSLPDGWGCSPQSLRQPSSTEATWLVQPNDPGFAVDTSNTVVQLAASSGARGSLRLQDRILSVNGVFLCGLQDLSSLLPKARSFVLFDVVRPAAEKPVRPMSEMRRNARSVNAMLDSLGAEEPAEEEPRVVPIFVKAVHMEALTFDESNCAVEPIPDDCRVVVGDRVLAINGTTLSSDERVACVYQELQCLSPKKGGLKRAACEGEGVSACGAACTLVVERSSTRGAAPLKGRACCMQSLGVYQAARDLSPTSRVGRGGTIRRRCGPPPVTLSDPPSVQFARPGNVARSPRVPCRPPVELLQAMNLQGVSAEKPFSLHQAMSLQGVQPG